MALLSALLILFIAAFIILAVAALPLFIAVHLLGGQTSIIRAIFVMLLVGLLSGILSYAFGSVGSIISFIVSVFIYREFFGLSLFSALFVTLVAWIVVVIFCLLAIAALAFLGLSSAHTAILSAIPSLPLVH